MYPYLPTLNYPFVNIVPKSLLGIITDAYIVHDPEDVPAALAIGPADATLFMEEFHHLGGNVNMTIRWEDGSLFMDTSTATLIQTSWSVWTVYQWTQGNKIVRVTIDNGSLANLANDPSSSSSSTHHASSSSSSSLSSLSSSSTNKIYSSSSSSSSAPPVPPNLHLAFGIKATHQRTKRLRRIRVTTTRVHSDGSDFAGDTPATYTFTGNPEIVAGYNMVLNVNPTSPVPGTASLRKFSKVGFDCIPGAGQGRFPDCQNQDLYIRLLNGQRADKRGNIILDARDCYWLERKVTVTDENANPRKGTVAPGQLTLHNDCHACSDCSDYARLYKKLRTVYERASTLYDRVQVALTNYNYYLNLLNVVKDYVDGDGADFAVYGSGSAVSLRVVVKSGNTPMSRIAVSITPPDGYTLEYVDGSGWSKLPGREGRKSDDLLKPTVGMNFAVNRNIPIHSVVWWEWSVKLGKEGLLEGTATSSHSVSFDLNVTITDVTDTALPVTRTYPTLTRTTDIIY